MSEFENIPMEKLEKIKFGLESYLEGCIDTYKIYQETFDDTMMFYNQKICAINIEIEKYKDKNESDN